MHTSPTFSGFPQTGLAFLANLATHNNREWFEAHKKEYQTALLEPAQMFIIALGEKLQTLAHDIHYDTRADGKGVLMRIYRDTRFSPDKTPYNTQISGLFWVRTRKKTESSAFGFQIGATGMELMTGIFKFSPSMLVAYRNAVTEDRSGTELEDILEKIRCAGQFEIRGDHYKQVPAGYDPNHRRARLLRYDGLYAFSPSIQGKELLTSALVDICFMHFQHMAPLHHWLMKTVVL